MGVRRVSFIPNGFETLVSSGTLGGWVRAGRNQYTVLWAHLVPDGHPRRPPHSSGHQPLRVLRG